MPVEDRAQLFEQLRDLVSRVESSRVSIKDFREIRKTVESLGYDDDAKIIGLCYAEGRVTNAIAAARNVLSYEN